MVQGLVEGLVSVYKDNCHVVNKVFKDNLCLLLLQSFLIKLKSYSYGSLVLSQLCVDSYHSNFILYVSYEAQKLGK